MCGYSEYDDQLWRFLKEVHTIGNSEGYDYLQLFPFFLLSGASIERKVIEDDIFAFIISVDEGKEDAFYRDLQYYLDKKMWKV